MPSQQSIPNDVIITGALTVQGATNLAAGSIGDAAIKSYAGTGTGVQASKLQQRFDVNYSQESATNAVTETRVIHTVRGAAATVNDFYAGAVVLLTGADTCTVDLKKNGSSILTAPLSLLAGDTIRVAKAATLASSSAVAGDCLEVTVTASHSSGTLPKGVFARLAITEDPS